MPRRLRGTVRCPSWSGGSSTTSRSRSRITATVPPRSSGCGAMPSRVRLSGTRRRPFPTGRWLHLPLRTPTFGWACRNTVATMMPTRATTRFVSGTAPLAKTSWRRTRRWVRTPSRPASPRDSISRPMPCSASPRPATRPLVRSRSAQGPSCSSTPRRSAASPSLSPQRALQSRRAASSTTWS